jgi:membrane-associated phospholipid phosphatase
VPLEQQPHPTVTVLEAPFHGLQDGKHILVAPIYLRRNDLKWLLPLTGAAAAAFATDRHTMTQVVSTNPAFNQTSANVSNGLVFGMIALPVSMFGFGEARHDEHLTEAGILGGEAMGDAIIVDELVKLCAWRERPYEDGGKGRFFAGRAGVDSSFVSIHSMVAWSSAAVIAGEYRSKWAKFGVYTAAAGVSLTRVMAQQHFPSDVLLGSAGGWLIGHYVFRAHHHWSQLLPQRPH